MKTPVTLETNTMNQRLLGYLPDELAQSPYASFFNPELAPPPTASCRGASDRAAGA